MRSASRQHTLHKQINVRTNNSFWNFRISKPSYLAYLYRIDIFYGKDDSCLFAHYNILVATSHNYLARCRLSTHHIDARI